MLSLPDFKAQYIILCFANEGQQISFKNDNLIIKDKEDKIILQSTCHKLFAVWIFGSTTLTSGILERSKKFAFSIYLMSYSNKLYGVWSASTEGNFLLRKKQYSNNSNAIPNHLIANKISNQAALLKTIRQKSDSLKETIALLTTYQAQALTAPDLKTLLGTEGIAARLYFKAWFGDIGWKGRKPRTKIDPLNALLDIGYTYLFNLVECMLNLYGFDLYQGVYHQSFYQRKSLVCDIVEPFRCIIDRQVKKAYNLKQINLEDFNIRDGRYLLRIDKNKEYSRWLMAALLEHKEPIFLYVQDYYRCFMRSKTIEVYPTFQLLD
jgi:CRISPR-associated protein Cas1